MSPAKPITEMSAAERAERLAELKARRRARLRKAAIGTGIGVASLLLVVVIAAYWLLQTLAGRDVLLAQLQARLPAGASLSWSAVEGPVAGPLTLHGVDFRKGCYVGQEVTARMKHKTELRKGLNTWRGQLTCKPVAEALSLPFSEVGV